MKKLILGLGALWAVHAAAQSSAGLTIEDYNRALPLWGTSWAPGANSVGGYYPSFYTGFAARSEFPERIHVRLSRGNQTRVTVILDDQTLSDYLFDLAKRDEFYNQVVDHRSLVNIASEKGARMFPQLEFYRRILRSPNYGILDFAHQSHSPEATYAKALATLSALNPGRVFQLHLDLKAAFLKWRAQVRETLKGSPGAEAYFAAHPEQAVTALDSLLWGRINFTDELSRPVLQRLGRAADLAVTSTDDAVFLNAALDLFKQITGSKYSFRVQDAGGQWQPALQCPNWQSCFLNYPEFTAIYPTGSVMETTTDSYGNRIASFATPGLWRFLSYPGQDVDNIRAEPYYSWIPKMDYESIGNGYHNPAVRFGSPSTAVKEALGVPHEHQTLEAVKRGGVSHGCSRLAMGHIWEMRHIFPVENSKMMQVHYFGSKPQDFDLYDVDGDGQPEVMGVEYLISYDLQGTSDVARREGGHIEIDTNRKQDFYRNLYGASHVFRLDSANRYLFSDPTVSLPSYLDLLKKSVRARLTVRGEYPLFEQAYEKDKVQFYVPYTTSGLTSSGASPLSKRIARLMGRIRGCAPTSDKNQCGEAAFDNEAQILLREIQH